MTGQIGIGQSPDPRDEVELSPFEQGVVTAFVEKLRNDRDATDNFIQSVVTTCMSYGHSHEVATLTTLARDVALTAEFVAAPDHDEITRRRDAHGAPTPLDEVFATLQH